MQEEEYTFVTLDGNDVMPADAVIIDVEGGGVDLGDAIAVSYTHLTLPTICSV